MAADTTRLQGEIAECPEEKKLNVELLLKGFLQALIDEQKIIFSTAPKEREPS